MKEFYQKNITDNFSIPGAWKDQDGLKFGELKYYNNRYILTEYVHNTNGYIRMPASKKENIIFSPANNNEQNFFIPKITYSDNIMENKYKIILRKWYGSEYFCIRNFNEELIDFKEVDVYLELFDEWAQNIISPKVSQYHLGNFNFKNNTFCLYIKVAASHICYLHLKAEKNISIEETISVSKELWKLFTFIFGKKINILKVIRKQEERKESIFFWLPTISSNNSDKNKLDSLSSFLGIDSLHWTNIIQNWFAMNSSQKLLVDNYLLTINYEEVIENKLINLTKGIESYYRNTTLSLLKKLNKFINFLPENMIKELNSIVGDTNTWLKRIKDTRVFIEHGDDRKCRIKGLHELSNSVDILQLIVRMYLAISLQDKKIVLCNKTIEKRLNDKFKLQLNVIFNRDFL